jgi:hypothetical protein
LNFISCHKLSQWLTYSLIEPLEMFGFVFSGLEKMTGLAEYRNGGLLIDMGVLSLKNPKEAYQVYDQEIVEWRALTIALLDKIAQGVREKLGLCKQDLPLAKVLEAGSFRLILGTWKAGREIAAKKRPQTKGPPLQIISDGTLF